METKERLLLTAVNAAIAAGKEIMTVYDDPRQDFGVETKADGSPLTKADMRADAAISHALDDTGICVLSEERAQASDEERHRCGRLWIVDPLDGTKEFIKRNGDFTVNIALAEGGTPVLGVVFGPVRRELYWGLCGIGAGKASGVDLAHRFADMGELAAASVALPLPRGSRPFTVVASRSHMNDETRAYVERLQAAHADMVAMSRGSSLKICMVAEGVADVYPRFAPTMEWDTAAGHAVAAAAGCEVVRADDGQPLSYNKADLHNPWFVVRTKTILA